MTDRIVVLGTCASPEEARSIARELVTSRLAACVNVAPAVASIYRWKGAIEESSEWLLIIKTRRDLFDAVRRKIEEMHSYQVPEALALAVVDGAPAYLDWWDSELMPPG
jgi:periplasmic divalent cation tolerance protein